MNETDDQLEEVLAEFYKRNPVPEFVRPTFEIQTEIQSFAEQERRVIEQPKQEEVWPKQILATGVPQIYDISPQAGPVDGNTPVTIDGDFFVDTDAIKTRIRFRDRPATNIVVVDDSTITANTPANAAGLADVIAENIDGQIGTLFGGFTYTPAPTISSASPRDGLPGGGTIVTLTGANFAPGATVTFGGVPATALGFLDAQHLLATTPAHGVGYVDIVVTNPSGQSGTLHNGFLYQQFVQFYQISILTDPPAYQGPTAFYDMDSGHFYPNIFIRAIGLDGIPNPYYSGTVHVTYVNTVNCVFDVFPTTVSVSDGFVVNLTIAAVLNIGAISGTVLWGLADNAHPTAVLDSHVQVFVFP